jgi:hypothetical protein
MDALPTDRVPSGAEQAEVGIALALLAPFPGEGKAGAEMAALEGDGCRGNVLKRMHAPIMRQWPSAGGCFVRPSAPGNAQPGCYRSAWWEGPGPT